LRSSLRTCSANYKLLIALPRTWRESTSTATESTPRMAAAVTRTLYKTALRVRKRVGEVVESEGYKLSQPILTVQELRDAFHSDPEAWKLFEGKHGTVADVQQLGIEYLQRAHKKAQLLEQANFIPRAEAAKPLQFRVGDVVWVTKTALRSSRASVTEDIISAAKKAGSRKKGTAGVIPEDEDEELVAASIIGWSPSRLTPSIVSSITGGFVPSMIARNDMAGAEPDQPWFYCTTLMEQTPAEASMLRLSAKEYYHSKSEDEWLRKISCFAPADEALVAPGLQHYRETALAFAGRAGRSDYLPQSALKPVILPEMTTESLPQPSTAANLAAFERLPTKVQELVASGVWWNKYFTGFDPSTCRFTLSPVVEELYPEDQPWEFERVIRNVAAYAKEKRERETEQARLLRESEVAEAPAAAKRAPRKRAPKAKKVEIEATSLEQR
jgi:hypothetical protein